MGEAARHLTDRETEAGLGTAVGVEEWVSGWWKENSGVLFPSSLPLTSAEHLHPSCGAGRAGEAGAGEETAPQAGGSLRGRVGSRPPAEAPSIRASVSGM